MQRPVIQLRDGGGHTSKVNAQLHYWAQQLHDLSGRNRLLYYHETRSSSAAILSPDPLDLFHLLVEKRSALRVPLPSAAELANARIPESQTGEAGELAELTGASAEPEEGSAPVGGIEASASPRLTTAYAEELVDTKKGKSRRATTNQGRRRSVELQTNHSVVHLNRVMYNLHYAARTVQEEQGFNILYMAFGMLRWRDVRSSTYSLAPLVLVPVRVEREHLASPYAIRLTEDDIVLNPVLQIKLANDFGLELPDVGNDLTQAGLREFLDESGERVRELENWNVEEQVTLGAFNFLTQLLIKDFEKNAPLYEEHPLVRWLSGLEPPENRSMDSPPAAIELDDVVDPAGVFQVLDADSSQQEAIEAAKRGLSFVMQGPPGTGKSQTIANLIAESMMAGKKVLFVSQKMAALEVVHSRLRRRGLGEFCLEVHNHRMDKRKVIQNLMQELTDSAVRVPNPEFETKKREIREIRDELNTYVRQLHEPRLALGLSLYELYGRLARHLQEPRLDFSYVGVENVTAHELGRSLTLLRGLAGRADFIREYHSSRWKGWLGSESTMTEREQTTTGMKRVAEALVNLHRATAAIARRYGLTPPATVGDDLEYAEILSCFKSQVFSAKLRGAITRYQVQELPGGQAFSLQYGEDSRKLSEVYRSRREHTTKEISEALTLVKKVLGRIQPSSRNQVEDDGDDSKEYQRMAAAANEFQGGFAAVREMFSEADLPSQLADVAQQPAEELAEWFSAQSQQTDQLAQWNEFQEMRGEAETAGLGDFVDAALANEIDPDEWEGAFCQRFYRLCVEQVMSDRPLLKRFRGGTHSDLVRRFRDLDIETIDMSPGRIRAELVKRKPRWSWMKAQSAETSILRRESNKKRGIKPLRKLFAEIPGLLQALKPCLMMSPLTVCQLLDPKIHHFDLAVFDEASQIPPEYAVSAVLRADQVIVAGDSQQLPPMNFFQAMEEDRTDDEDEMEAPQSAEFESILTLCESRGFPSKMLNWHYRSRDESLIAYSNYHFYDNRLFTFPSAGRRNAASGLQFVFVPEGIYRSGEGARNNLTEAKRVAELVFQHLKQTPELSLGVVAFSVPQRQAIEREIERQRLQNHGLEGLFRSDGQEPLFIKNLENVQGDERDAIILSVGYGRDETGKTALNFGPLNRDGGDRRLNVAVTRARRLLYLVSSMQPEDIDLKRAPSTGARLLRSYLETARDGVGALPISEQDEEEPGQDAALVESVYDALTGRGLDVTRRVGVSQYRVELAIRDSQDESRFSLGLESDGGMYRSGLTARDRDRLRQQVLEGLGWRIHRIWSRDWVEGREAEIDRIMRALSEGATEPESSSRRAQTASKRPGRLTEPHASPEEVSSPLPPGAVPYRTPELPAPKKAGLRAFLEAPLSEVIDALQNLANAEGPIARGKAEALVLRAWSARRSDKVEERFEKAIRRGIAEGAYMLNGDFLWPHGRKVAPLRVHTPGEPLRKITEIAPEEIQEGVRECVSGSVTIRKDDLVREVGRLFGLRATADNAGGIETVVEAMLNLGALREVAGKVELGKSSVARS